MIPRHDKDSIYHADQESNMITVERQAAKQRDFDRAKIQKVPQDGVRFVTVQWV